VSYVVDANVVVKWFVETERFRAEARAFLRQNYRALEAPDLLLIEIANAARRKTSFGEISHQQAREMLPATRDSIVEFHPSGELVERALEMALELDHSIYDCIYLACAETTGSILVTDDDRFVRKVVASPFRHLIRSLVEVQ